jgi:tryptophan 7-halogenase
LILHYIANEKTHLPFWQRCRELPLPEALAGKIELFRSSGRILREQEELFTDPSWLQVMVGQGILPERWHPMVEMIDEAALENLVEGTRQVLENAAAVMPTHADYIAKHCAAGTP